MAEDDESYFTRRAAEELEAARLATSQAAFNSHYGLALRYADLANGIIEHRRIIGLNWGVLSNKEASAA